jgi:hypothetical protein
MTILLTGYKSTKELKASIGKELVYKETSMFGLEYKANGKFIVAHRPAVSGLPGHEFFAEVVMVDGKISKIVT